MLERGLRRDIILTLMTDHTFLTLVELISMFKYLPLYRCLMFFICVSSLFLVSYYIHYELRRLLLIFITKKAEHLKISSDNVRDSS